MKKICILLATIMLVTATGCGNDYDSEKIVDKMIEKTYKAIKKENIDKALNYGRTAIEEGYDDDDFIELLEGLELYLDVKDALDKNDLKTAKDKFDEITSYDQKDISDLITELEENLSKKTEDVDNMLKSLESEVENNKDGDDFVTSAQAKLKGYVLTEEQQLKFKKIIEEHENKVADDESNNDFFQRVSEIDSYIKLLKEGMDDYDTTLVASMMVKLTRMDPYMNENQRKMTYAYWNDWNELQKSTEPSVNISPDEAIEIARKALNIPSNGCVVAVQTGEYYTIRSEVDYGDYIDEKGCCVSTYDGAVFGEVG